MHTGAPISQSLAAVVAGWAALTGAGVSRAEEAAVRSGSLYGGVAPAFVEVLVDGHLAGSGFFVDAEGAAVTAEHVIGGPDAAVEILSRRGRFRALVTAVDCGHDLALLAPADGARFGGPVPFLELRPADDGAPDTREPVFLLGTPIYRHALLLAGHVARPEPGFEWMNSSSRYHRVIYVSGMSPIGSSGGPWIDLHGRCFALQSGIMSVSSGMTGVCFAAPADAIRRLSETRTHAATPTLGVAVDELWERPASLVSRFPDGSEGALVAKTVPNGPAERAGIQPDDLIVAVNGARIRLRDELLNAIRQLAPDDIAALAVIRTPDPESPPNPSAPRGSRELTLNVTLGRLETPYLPKSPDE